MFHGTLPPLSPPAGAPEYSRGSWPLAALEGDGPLTSRRQWLFALGGLFVGVSASAAGLSAIGAGGGRPVEAASPAFGKQARLEWAIDMAGAPADALIHWSGDLGRLAAAHSHEPRLVPTMERLLEAALESRGAVGDADSAAASAVRGLRWLHREDRVRALDGEIRKRPELRETNELAARILGSGK